MKIKEIVVENPIKKLVRYGVSALGGVLVAKGVVGEEVVQGWIAPTVEVVGGVIVFAAMPLLSYVQELKLAARLGKLIGKF